MKRLLTLAALALAITCLRHVGRAYQHGKRDGYNEAIDDAKHAVEQAVAEVTASHEFDRNRSRARDAGPWDHESLGPATEARRRIRAREEEMMRHPSHPSLADLADSEARIANGAGNLHAVAPDTPDAYKGFQS